MKTRKRKITEQKASPGTTSNVKRRKSSQRKVAERAPVKITKPEKKVASKTKTTSPVQRTESKRKSIVVVPISTRSQPKNVMRKETGKGKATLAKDTKLQKPELNVKSPVTMKSAAVDLNQPVIIRPAKAEISQPVKTISLKKVTQETNDSSNQGSPIATGKAQQKDNEVIMVLSPREPQKPEPTPEELLAELPEPHAERGSDAEELVTEHNYSKDPKDALMKLNLPIYACALCKKYTFDSQQSVLHSRTVHDGKVGIIFMLPLDEIMQGTPNQQLESITVSSGPHETKPSDAKQDSGATSNKQTVLKLNELANVQERAMTRKQKFECENCHRQFDRERQMNRHKCIQVASKRQSPHRGDTGFKVHDRWVPPYKTAGNLGKGTSSSEQSDQGTPTENQQIEVLRTEVSTGEEELDPEPGEEGSGNDVSNKSAEKIGVNKMMDDDVEWKQKATRKYSVTAAKDGDAMGTDSDEDDEADLEDIEVDDDLLDTAPDQEKSGTESESQPRHVSFEHRRSPSFEEGDEMMSQWKNRGPPSQEELSKFIKSVQGGLQGAGGPPLTFFMCLICRKVFKTKNVLKPHLYAHLGYRPFSCAKCGFSATHSHALQLHMKRHLGDKLSCWYSACSFIGKDEEDLTKHRNTHVQSIECELCKVSLCSQSTLLGHLCIKHPEEIKEGEAKKFYMRMIVTGRRSSQIVLFECDICGLKSKTKKAYYNHIRVHNEMKSPKIGNRPASQLQDKTKQKPKKSDDVPVECPMCETKVRNENSLIKHLSTHPFIYRCSMCERKFLTYGSLNEHVCSHMHEVRDFSPQEKINESLRKSMYFGGEMDKALEADKMQWAQRRTGALAPKSAITGSTFDELMAKIDLPTENVAAEELDAMGKPFTSLAYKQLTPSILRYIHMRFGNVECGVCGKLFPKVGSCKDHTKKHNQVKEYKCPKCPYQGNLKAAFLKHMATIHKDGEKFTCEVCQSTVIGKELLDAHMKRHAMESEGPFICTWCNLVEKQRGDMRNHILNTHPLMPLSESTKILGTGVVVHRDKGAPFLVCEVCSETFRRICDLRRHMWKHSTVKRFTCEVCDYGSDKRSNIISHMRRHSQERCFPCEHCNKAYKTEQALKMHVRTAHLKLKPFKCDLCDYAAAQPVHLRRHKFIHHGGERRRFKCTVCPDYKASDLQIIRRHYEKKHPLEQFNVGKCCPEGFRDPSLVRKDKHQVIQVVPAQPTAGQPVHANPEAATSPEKMPDPDPAASPDKVPESEPTEEVVLEEEAVQVDQSLAIADDVPVITIDDQSHAITDGMTVEVVLPEEQAHLIDINTALPDVINALANLQESDFNHQ